MTHATIFDAPRTITVTGAPGTGKTRDVVIPALAAWPGCCSLAFDVRGELRDVTAETLEQAGVHVCEIDVANLCFSNLRELFATTFKTAIFVVGDAPQGLAEMIAFSTRGICAGVQMLLIFDDCEIYLTPAAAARLLDGDSGPRILMTTQRKNYPRGDQHIEK